MRSRRVVTPEGIARRRSTSAAARSCASPRGTTSPGDAASTTGGELAVLPGIVDTHVHINEPGRTEWEGFATATRAAAAGGVTTLVDMPLNCDPADHHARRRSRRSAPRRAGQCAVDVGFWGGVVPGNAARARRPRRRRRARLQVLPRRLGRRRVRLGRRGRPRAGDADPRRAAACRCSSTPSSPGRSTPRPRALGRRRSAPLRDVPRVAPAAPRRSRRSRCVIALCRETGARTHIVHLSSASALPLLARRARRGPAAHRRDLPALPALRRRGRSPTARRAFKCAPPIRERENREALWARARRGRARPRRVAITRRARRSSRRSRPATSSRAWGGIAALQLALPVVWTEARARGHRSSIVARWMSAAPARLAGLAAARARSPRAATPTSSSSTDAERHDRRRRERSSIATSVTPYAGETLRGVVRATYLRGAARRRAAAALRRDRAAEQLLMTEPDVPRSPRPRLPSAVGGAALARNDEFFAEKENLLKRRRRRCGASTSTPIAASGWTAGRRAPPRATPRATTGASSASACRASIRGVVVDTAFFRGNYPESCAIDACRDRRRRSICARSTTRRGRELAAAHAARRATRKNAFAIAEPRSASRTCGCDIFPDGGVARLRVHGEVVPRLGAAARARRRRRSRGARARRASSRRAATCSSARATT